LGVDILVDGQNVAEISGMLNGEHLCPDGWISIFSLFPSKSEDYPDFPVDGRD
jgi:hypothetical protein